jgi:twitching motility protein PilT
MSENYNCIDLLVQMNERNGTDLILSVGKPPQVRVSTTLHSLDYEDLTPRKAKELCYEVMNEFHQKNLESEGEVDFAFSLKEEFRVRSNVFRQRGYISGSFRRIPNFLLPFEELGLPSVIKTMADRPSGLILVTGPTGSGKSTTLASIVDRINSSRYCHIITLEDPIEYLHSHKKATVDQREINNDTSSFITATRSILRQDPDVVLLGEMRDAESIQAALTVAETGHLCLATLHTNSCSQTLSRIVDVFPGEKQQQIRTQLAMTVNCIISQQLMPKIGGGLQLALEIMVGTSAIKALIRENKLHTIDNQIKLGSKFGMQSLNSSLVALIKTGLITEEDAQKASPDIDDLKRSIVETL